MDENSKQEKSKQVNNLKRALNSKRHPLEPIENMDLNVTKKTKLMAS